MINVLLPSMGTSDFFKDSYFPKLLTEINGKTMLEMVIDNYRTLNGVNCIFVLPDDDCKKFHLDNSAKVLLPTSCVIKLKGQTAGALCTCLMAVEYIDNDDPLIIANADQTIEVNYNEVLANLRGRNFDAGVITFPSIHPRWSYIRTAGEEVVEVAEKRPITKNAIAGFYYFNKGKYFVEAAKAALLKREQLNGVYYISSSINELILSGKRIGYYEVEKNRYCSFYSPAKIKEYEERKR